MIFGAGGGVKKGLRRIGDNTKAQEIDLKIESEDGILTDSEAVREGVEYGEEGNAVVTAKALNGERWSSTKQKMVVKMKDLLDSSKEKTEETQEWLRQALDRGSDSINIDADNSDPRDRDN